MSAAENQDVMERGKPFDQAIADEMAEAFRVIVLKHPEIRSLSGVIDYYGRLNDSEVHRAVWFAPERSPDAVFGSALQTFQLLATHIDNIMNVLQSMRQEAVKLGQEVVNQNEKIQALKAEQEKLRAEKQSG